jgi:adenylylsulfate kinase
MSGAEGVVVWLTGLPRAGKSTLAERVRQRLQANRRTVILDGDEVRDALVPRPGYDDAARDGFYRTLANLAALLARQGLTVLVPATAHRRVWRAAARTAAPRFVEVHVATPLKDCQARDPAGLYRSAARDGLPGVGVVYEAPAAPDVTAEGGDDDRAVELLTKRFLATE